MADEMRSGRREFLKATAAASAATLLAEAARAADPSKPPVPLVTLGKTGEKVTRLGMGTSWHVAESFVQRAIAAGVRYIDTSETYERGNSEKTIGTVLERTGQAQGGLPRHQEQRLRPAQGRCPGEVLRDPARRQPRAAQD